MRCAWAVWPPIAVFVLCLEGQQAGAPQLRPLLHPPIRFVSPSGRQLSAPAEPPTFCLSDGAATRNGNSTSARRGKRDGPQVIAPSDTPAARRPVLCDGRRVNACMMSLSRSRRKLTPWPVTRRRVVSGPAECKDAAFCPTLVRLEGPPCGATITASLATST